MIRIKRYNDCPDMLRNGVDIDNRNCKREVVETLHEMQHGKCCYCEKKIEKDGHGQAIDHFRPKAPGKFPELKNEWSNLLHSCADCNGKKGSQFPKDENDNPLIIDPSDPDIDPEEHLDFDTKDPEDVNFARISPKDGSELGRTTIGSVRLDIVRCRRGRFQRYRKLNKAYLEIVEAEKYDAATKPQRVRTFEALLGANEEYAAFARAFARNNNLHTDHGVRIPVGCGNVDDE